MFNFFILFLNEMIFSLRGTHCAMRQRRERYWQPYPTNSYQINLGKLKNAKFLPKPKFYENAGDWVYIHKACVNEMHSIIASSFERILLPNEFELSKTIHYARIS